jgi:hypothetical protein|tara:strand:+ start:608 stop:784 length:177 start_codon:yes stop_codon:yes gene_type:complete
MIFLPWSGNNVTEGDYTPLARTALFVKSSPPCYHPLVSEHFRSGMVANAVVFPMFHHA